MHRSKSPLFLITFFVVLALLLSSCGQAAAPVAEEPEETKAEPAAVEAEKVGAARGDGSKPMVAVLDEIRLAKARRMAIKMLKG